MHKKCGNVRQICRLQKKSEQIRTLDTASFLKEELQQTMSANPVLVYRNFLSFVFGVDACFVFDFVVFYL